jgi:hypothetical protein
MSASCSTTCIAATIDPGQAFNPAQRSGSSVNPAWRVARLGLALLLGGCSVARFDQPGVHDDPAAYATVFPTYAEFCAVSQIKKKPGFGADIRGQVGGHAVFYLNGACRDDEAGYPVLRLCDPTRDHEDGVGLSMNAHFSNAKFVAVPGRDFFFQGDMPAGAPVDRAAYARIQRRAKQLRLYDGITFHPEVFTDMPAGWNRADYKYEVSVATDYAIAFGRGRHCARIPVDRTQLRRMVDFLNAENAPYRSGAAVFRWSVFRDNCIHLAHNALAAAGLWPEWRSHESLLWAMLDFPVPRNEFVNIMRRTQDVTLLDPGLLYRDATARRDPDALDALPPLPGALAVSQPPLGPNSVYDTDVDLIFYDEPVFGHYQEWSDAIFADPRRTDLRTNLEWYAGLYRDALQNRRSLPDSQTDDPRYAGFKRRFYEVLEQRQTRIDAGLRGLGATQVGAR